MKVESNFKDVEIFLLFSKLQYLFQKKKCIVLFSGTFPNVAEGIHQTWGEFLISSDRYSVSFLQAYHCIYLFSE